jgi:hypothetical protein
MAIKASPGVGLDLTDSRWSIIIFTDHEFRESQSSAKLFVVLARADARFDAEM